MFAPKKYILLLFFLSCTYKINGIEAQSPPVVLWHGMGDSCCFAFSLGAIKKLIESEIPGIFVYSVRLGNNEIEDVEHSYIGDINDQIQEICQELGKNEQLKNGYNAIGFSQGAQFLRAIIQKCPYPPVKNFISLGGQHQGVFGLPNCGTLKRKVCSYVAHLIKYGAYTQFVQNKLIQATYWHDPYQEEEYKQKSVFLADINNERYINKTYKQNLQKLNAMVLVKFTQDSIVWPRETEWFGFYKPGQETEIQTFKETDIYRKDLLGLKALYEAGKIHFLSVPGNHLQFTADWFINEIVKPYLI